MGGRMVCTGLISLFLVPNALSFSVVVISAEGDPRKKASE